MKAIIAIAICALTVLTAISMVISAEGQLAIGASAGNVGNNAGHYQNVGGDFGRAWIKSFQAQNPPSVQTSQNNSLWNWGGAPVDKILVNGALVPKSNVTPIVILGDWIGETSLWRPVYLNSSYNLGAASPLSPSYLSDDPWIRAQQLETVVVTPANY